jgi:hypothetical protein
MVSEILNLWNFAGYFTVRFEIKYFAFLEQIQSPSAGWLLLLPGQLHHKINSCTVINPGLTPN